MVRKYNLNTGPLVSNCILFCYESHIGQVKSLDVSPSHRNALASAGEDGTIKLYNTLQVLLVFKVVDQCTLHSRAMF